MQSSSSGLPPQLWHISKVPVAGAAFFTTTGTVLHYVERGTGYVFEANPTTGTITRLTDTLIPKTYEALFSKNGHIYLRSLAANGDITTFVGSIATTSATSTGSASVRPLVGQNLALGMASLTIDPVTGDIFYLTKSDQGEIGVHATWNGLKPKTIFSSPIQHWQTTWLSDGHITLTQSAATGVMGYAYTLGSDGSLAPLQGPTPGLTVRAKSGGTLLWGAALGASITLSVKANAASSAVVLPIHTLPEKCAWTSAAKNATTTASAIAYCAVPQTPQASNYMEDWYRGALHTADAFWKVDAGAGSAENVFTPDSSMSLDVENPTIDQSGNYIAFINKADDSLWLLRINK
jgi:hypothetical protein